MYANIEKYFKIFEKFNEEEKLKILVKEVNDELQKEKNFFKFISLIGIINIIKIFNGLKYNDLLINSYITFENYFFNKFDENTNIENVSLLIKNFENYFHLSKLTDSLIKKKSEKIIFYYMEF